MFRDDPTVDSLTDRVESDGHGDDTMAVVWI
jgi:hypothetical protein